MNPRDALASRTQSASSVPGPNTQASLPLVGEATLKVASSCGERTVRAALREVPPYEAVMVDDVEFGTVDVLTVNDAPDCPPATVTVDGTCATVGLLLESCTTTPVEGALPVNVMVPIGCDCPATDD